MSLKVETLSTNAMSHSYTPSESVTHVAESEEVDVPKDKIENALGNLDVNWENDPDNARNWSFGRKWTAIAIASKYLLYTFLINFSFQVSFYTFVSPLASSMMAPGLPEIATKYGITNSTVVALTLSIFLLAYALGVSSILLFI